MLIKFGTLLSILWVIFLFPQETLAYTIDRDWQNNISSAQSRSITVIHTVKEKESLWKIAKNFDIKFSILAQLNQLENPDLIFPGDRLVIEIKDDFSVVVRTGVPYRQEELGSSERINKAFLHVTRPSKDDIFAPEVPTAAFEVPEVISKEPRRGPSQYSRVFNTFSDFIQWLKGNFNPAQNYNTGATLDPPSSAPYMPSQGLFKGPLFLEEDLYASVNFYQPFIPDSLAPPPKSL